MIEKALFDDLGGFDSHYAPAYFEDTDLCFRVRKRGKRVVMQPGSKVIHREGATSGVDVSAGVKHNQVLNHRKFLDRWREELSSHAFHGQNTEGESERGVTRRALFIDDAMLTPDQDAGSNAALQHILSLQRLGYKVTFLPAADMARPEPYAGRLQAIGVECLCSPYFSCVEDVLRRSGGLYDLVYLHRFSNGTKYPGLIRNYLPRARLIYSVGDLHFLRMQRQSQFDAGSDTAMLAKQMKRAELQALRAVDAAVVHSPHEAEVLAREDKSINVCVVPWTIAARPVATPFSDRSGLAFIGSYTHLPNADAAQYLAAEIMPLVARRNGAIICKLVGSRVTPEVQALQGANVQVVGHVSDLAEVFESVRLTVAPLRYGAGIKGKVLDSFSAGIACIMTSVAAEGLDLPPALQGLVADTPEEIADRIVELHENQALCESLGAACLDYVQARNSPQTVDRDLMLAVDPRRAALLDATHKSGDALDFAKVFAPALDADASGGEDEPEVDDHGDTLARWRRKLTRPEALQSTQGFALSIVEDGSIIGHIEVK